MIWKQEKNIAILNEKYFFKMPTDWKLSTVHPDILKFSEWLLYYPWRRNHLKGYVFTRKGGDRIGLAYSGGVDSVAAYLCLPKGKTDLIWNKEDQSRIKTGDLTNAQNAMSETSKRDNIKVYEVLTNQHEIRADHGLSAGYSSPFAVCVPAMLLADYLGLGYLSTGSILESVFLGPQGYAFRDYTSTNGYLELFPKLEQCGLKFIAPTFGISEITTKKMVENSHLSDVAQSCVSGTKIGVVCGKCIKCYRKGDAEFKNLPLNLQKTISQTKPPKMWASLAHRFSETGNWYGHPKTDLSFLENTCYPKALELCEPFKEEITDNLAAYGVHPMDTLETEACENFKYGETN
jgi:hypothetical protein